MEDEDGLHGEDGRAAQSSTDYVKHQCCETPNSKSIPKMADNTGKSMSIAGVTLRCGLCDYTTTSMSKLRAHTSHHVSLTDPFKCTHCSETFPSYSDIQKHPCGAGGFAFLLSSPGHTENSSKTTEVVDLSSMSNRKKQFTNIVYVPPDLNGTTNEASEGEELQKSPEQSKVELAPNSGSSTPVMDRHSSTKKSRPANVVCERNESSAAMNQEGNDDALQDLPENEFPSLSDSPIGTPMVLRKRQPLKYNDVSQPEEAEEPLEPKIEKKPSAKAKKEKKPENQPIIYRCRYCSFTSQYPGNRNAHFKKHLVPGRSHFDCKRCGLKFLVRRSLISHHCSKSKSQSSGNKTSTHRLTRARQPQVFPENKDLTFLCRLCEFTSTPKINLIKHVHRHRCKSCREFFPTVLKCSKHSSNCFKSPAKTNERTQQAKNTSGEFVYFRRSVPSTLVQFMCLVCKVKGFKSFRDFDMHVCQIGKKGKANGVHPKGTPGSKPQPKGPSGKMEGYDEGLMMYCCKYCLFTSPSALALISHNKKLQHSPRNVPLVKSPEVQAMRFDFARKMEVHRKTPRMDGWDDEAMVYVCKLCKFNTPTPIALFNHKRKHELEDETNEPPVDISVEEEEEGNTKQAVDQDDQPAVALQYKCSTCSFTSDTEWDLSAHEGLHGGDRPLNCDMCSIGFSNKFHLNIHKLKAHVHAKTAMENFTSTCCPESGCEFFSEDSTVTKRHHDFHHKQMNNQSEVTREIESNESDLLLQVETEPVENRPQSGCSFAAKDPAMLNHHLSFHFSSSEGTGLNEYYAGPSASRSVAPDAQETLNESRKIIEPEDDNHFLLCEKAARSHSDTPLALTADSQSLAENDTSAGARLRQMSKLLGYRLEQASQHPTAHSTETNPNQPEIYTKPNQRSIIKHRLANWEASEDCLEKGPALSEGGNVAAADDLKENTAGHREGSVPNVVSSDIECVPMDLTSEGQCSPAIHPAYASPSCSYAKSSARISSPVSAEDEAGPEPLQRDYKKEKGQYAVKDRFICTTDNMAPSPPMPALSPLRPQSDDSSLERHPHRSWRTPGWPHSWRGQPSRPQMQLLSLRTLTTTTTTATTAPPAPLVAGGGPPDPDRASPTLPRAHSQGGAHVEAPPAAAIHAPLDLNQNEAQKAYLHRYPAARVPTEHRCGFCRIYFEDFRLFVHHLTRHHHENPWVCTHCWRDFGNVFAFLDHH